MADLKFGVVESYDPATARARVVFDEDGLLSWWLAVGQSRTFKDKAVDPIDPGEHVACLMDDNAEDGVILCAIYSTADEPPVSDPNRWHRLFEDGTSLEYDRSTHQLTGHIVGDYSLIVDGEYKIRAGNIDQEALSGHIRIRSAREKGGRIKLNED